MAASEENGCSQGTLVDVDRTTCTDVRVLSDRLVLALEMQVPLRPTGHHIVGFNAGVTGT